MSDTGGPSDQTLVFDSKLLRRGFTQVPNALLEDERLSAGAKVTMISLLSFAWQGSIFPGQERLCRMVNCTDKTLRGYIQELIVDGYLSVKRRGQGQTNVYTILAASFSRTVETPVLEQEKSTDEEYEVQEDKPLAAAPRERKKNPVWDALTYIFGEPTTTTATKVRGKVAASITLAGGTGEEVVARAKRWPDHFPGATMTDLALEKHWHTLARKPLRRTG